MFLGISVLLVSLWYLISAPKIFDYGKDVYAFLLMLVYLMVYLNTPIIQEESQILNRFEYVFSLYPVVAYYMILFPQSIFIPLHQLFPDLPDYLAERAIIVFSYVGLVVLLGLLILIG